MFYLCKDWDTCLTQPDVYDLLLLKFKCQSRSALVVPLPPIYPPSPRIRADWEAKLVVHERFFLSSEWDSGIFWSPFLCVGRTVSLRQPFKSWATASTVDPMVSGQLDSWASAWVPGFRFYPLLGGEPRLNPVQLAKALTLSPSSCQLSLFLFFLPWSICRSLGRDSGHQDARNSCFPECHAPPLALRSGPSCCRWSKLHLYPLQLHLNPH